MKDKKATDQNYQCHVFICTNKKEGKPCCADKNASQLRSDLKSWAAKKYGKKVRINNSGCLDLCSEGIAAVIYPQNEWFKNLDVSDIEMLQKSIDEKMGQ